MSALDDRLLAAHRAGDGRALAALYAEAAEAAEAAADPDAAAFFLTQALVFALEAGGPLAAPLRARLAEMGRI